MAQPAEEPPAPTPLPIAEAGTTSSIVEPDPRSARDHLRVLRRRWPIVLISAVAAALAALMVSLLQPTQYQATAELLVPLQVPTISDPGQPLQVQRAFDPNRAMQDEARLATAAVVAGEVRQRAGDGIALNAKPVKDADVLQITATAASGERAEAGANAAAEVYLQRHNAAVAKGDAPAVILHPATAPADPSQPTTGRNVGLALIGGLLLGLALAFVIDALARD